MSNVTQVLSQIEAGNQRASAELLPLVYQELRRLAVQRMNAERPDHTLQATALVHEAYMRLTAEGDRQSWNSRGHFYSAAAEAMRRILIESARSKSRLKRNGRVQSLNLDTIAGTPAKVSTEQLLELDDVLTKLEREDPIVAELVRLRLFAGLSTAEAAQVVGVSRSTGHEYWRFALAWFAVELDR